MIKPLPVRREGEIHHAEASPHPAVLAGEGRGALHAPAVHHVPRWDVRFGSHGKSSDDLSTHAFLEVVSWFV